MATFVLTQALNILDNQKNLFINKINSTSFGTIIPNFENSTRWRKDKISNKLSELSIQTSTYNKVIPNVYGINKIAGNVIWLDEVKQISNNNTITIKLSKGQKIKQNTIEYFYFLSFAIAICGNEISELRNVWADNSLLNLNDYKYRFYSGKETQNVDPLILSKNPMLPAYRGLSYIVFEDFPITQFNNRLPNFLFEIKRKEEFNKDSFVLKSLDGIKFANGKVGNFSYSTSIVEEAIEAYSRKDLFLEGKGFATPINCFNNDNISDCSLSLKQLEKTIDNYEYCVIGSHFFTTSKNIANIVLTPRTEIKFVFSGTKYFNGAEIFLRPYEWSVGNFTRANTQFVNSQYYQYGTPVDLSILEFVTKLKQSGKKIVFCPELFIEVAGGGSSKDLTGNISDIYNFFNRANGYNDFILHYANLLKNYVNVFLIGNELSGLTRLKDENNNFVAVNELILLAQKVRNIVGNNVQISYSAGYQEYHNYNGWYNLDKLWSNNNINFIGLKAYFPLTYCSQNEIIKNIIKNGWESGEGYNYITNNLGIKENIPSSLAYKNIKYWLDNKHINPNGIETEWEPKTKNIWFTEFGFPSINAGTNEPYKVFDEKNNNLLPNFSTGEPDFIAQKLAIESTLEYWKDKEFMGKMFLSSWDLRPLPFYPNKTSLWDDCVLWKYNYNINGKLDNSSSTDLIYQLFKDADLPVELIDKIEVNEFIDGFVINNNINVRDALYILQKVYFFDCTENFDKINFLSNRSIERTENSIYDINSNDLIKIDNKNGENEIYFKITNILENNLPKKLSIIFIDKNNEYDTNLVYYSKDFVNSNVELIKSIPVILDELKAKNIANILLNSIHIEKNIFQFSLPLKYIFLETSDLINFVIKNKSYTLKIVNVNLNEKKLDIVAKQFDNSIFDVKNSIQLNDNLEIIKKIQKTGLIIFELPCIYDFMYTKIHLFFAVEKNSKLWNGSNIYFSNSYGKEFKLLQQVSKNSVIGTLVNFFDNGNPYYIDKASKIEIYFNDFVDTEFMKNISIFEMLNGENIVILGKEIIQFQEIILNENGNYTLSKLLRGLYGTESEIQKHEIGEKFIFLNDNFYQELNYDKVNVDNFYKIVNLNDDISNSDTVSHRNKGTNLKPLKICHFKKKDNLITWERIDRGYTNWLDNFENESVESEEKYCLDFYINNKIFKKYYVNERQFILDDELKNNVLLKIYQVNKIFGIGEIVKILL